MLMPFKARPSCVTRRLVGAPRRVRRPAQGEVVAATTRTGEDYANPRAVFRPGTTYGRGTSVFERPG